MLQEEDLLIDYLLNDINYFQEEVFLTGGKRRKPVDCASWITNNGSEEDVSPTEIHLFESSSSSSPTSLSSSSNQRRPFGPLSVYKTQQQQQKRMVLPKILKSDIRRKFLIMFANVMNSYDFSLMSSFFKAFCVSDLSLFNVKNDCCPPHLYGRDLVAGFFFFLFFF
jgi:predicted helicase